MDQTISKIKELKPEKTAGVLAAVGSLWSFMQIISPNYWTGVVDVISLLMCIAGTVCFFMEGRLNHPKAQFYPILLIYTGSHLIWFSEFLYYMFYGWDYPYLQLLLLVGIFLLLLFCALGRISPKAPAVTAALFVLSEYLLACIKLVPDGHASAALLFGDRLPGFLLTASVVVGLFHIAGPKEELSQ